MIGACEQDPEHGRAFRKLFRGRGRRPATGRTWQGGEIRAGQPNPLFGKACMTIPNLISIARLLAVPVMIWALIGGNWPLAFATFVVAGISDAVDGAIARHFDQQSTLGLYLDPLADKALLSTVFIGLGLLGRLPDWLVIAVVSRDVLIVAAFLLAYVMGLPMTVRPLFVSKATTAAQIVLAAAVLGESAFEFSLGYGIDLLVAATLILTVASAAAYLTDWLRHMASPDEAEPKDDGNP